MEKIVEHGLIPGGWPQRTGRAHNFFIASHPWDDSVGGKKLAGTRAGKQYYVAFDTELIVQSGCRLFRTDEAIISPDWISNENIICTYDSVNREFAWINRPYEITRVVYNAKMKEHKDKDTPRREALSTSPYANARASLKSYLMSGKSIHPGEMQMTTSPEEIPPLLRRREGPSGPFEDRLTLKMASFGALSNAETIRKGKGRGKGKGKGSRPGGQAQRSTNAEDYIYSTKLEMQQVKCHFCGEKNIEGTHKCQSCFKWLIAWSDGRIATEVCRMEITAKKTSKVFSLDKIDFEKQPRAQRVSDRTRADQRRAGRSNFGNLKDAAQTHAGRYTKLGFKSIQDRMEKDPFYLFNNAVGQIIPDCCQFLEDLAKCIAPDVGRTREKREKQLGTGVSTRLIFMPDFNRDIRLPLDVTKEAMVAHHARVFTLPQFAVLAADLLKARGEPTPTLLGWSGSMMPVDQQSAQDCFFDLVDFAKRQWNEQFHNIKGEEHSLVEEATASDVAEFPLARSTKRVPAKDERGIGVILTQSRGQPRARAMDINGQSFSRLLNAGSAVSLATSPLNAAVDGTGGKDGTLTGLTQAVREDRPIGKAGIGGVVTKVKDRRQMTGGAQQLQVPLHHLRSLHDLHPHRHQCLTLHQQLRKPRPQRPLERRRAVDRFL